MQLSPQQKDKMETYWSWQKITVRNATYLSIKQHRQSISMSFFIINHFIETEIFFSHKQFAIVFIKMILWMKDWGIEQKQCIQHKMIWLRLQLDFICICSLTISIVLQGKNKLGKNLQTIQLCLRTIYDGFLKYFQVFITWSALCHPIYAIYLWSSYVVRMSAPKPIQTR